MLSRLNPIVLMAMIVMSTIPVNAQQRAVGSRAPAMPVSAPINPSGMGASPGAATGATAPSMGANPGATNPGSVAPNAGGAMGMRAPTTNTVK
jgi:hypothetical protein